MLFELFLIQAKKLFKFPSIEEFLPLVYKSIKTFKPYKQLNVSISFSAMAISCKNSIIFSSRAAYLNIISFSQKRCAAGHIFLFVEFNLQNTFFKAWQNIEYFRGEAKMSTWLFRIAFNECLAFTNKKRASETVSFDSIDSDILNKLESDPYFNGDDIQKKFMSAIHQLPQKQQMVFNMKYFQEMKYEEMSEIFGTSVGALKASYHHAVKKIEAILEKL